MPRRKRPPLANAPDLAIELVEGMDLPDGAHFALLEELTGMDAPSLYAEDFGEGVELAELECAICGKQCRTEHGFKMHQAAKHGLNYKPRKQRRKK